MGAPSATGADRPRRGLTPYPAQNPLPPARLMAKARPCPRPSRSRQAALAQSVEHIIRNDGVTCSSHVSGTTFLFPYIAGSRFCFDKRRPHESRSHCASLAANGPGGIFVDKVPRFVGSCVPRHSGLLAMSDRGRAAPVPFDGAIIVRQQCPQSQINGRNGFGSPEGHDRPASGA